MHVEDAEYRGWRSETQRNIVADPDKHMMRARIYGQVAGCELNLKARSNVAL